MDKRERDEIYARRERNIRYRNAENAEIGASNGLTEDQCHALERICSRRHDLHSTDVKSLIASESADFDLWHLCEHDRSESFYAIAESVGLPAFDPSIESLADEAMDYTDMAWYNWMDDEEKDSYEQQALEKGFDDGFSVWFDEACAQMANILNRINNLIEDYLLNIDKTYGTSYCPTGATRLF